MAVLSLSPFSLLSDYEEKLRLHNLTSRIIVLFRLDCKVVSKSFLFSKRIFFSFKISQFEHQLNRKSNIFDLNRLNSCVATSETMAKRIAKSSINWSALAERVPASQKPQFLAFKGRSDKYLRAVLDNPEQSPKIDWSAYKQKIPNAALVDSFQKSYESLKIAYPADNVSGEVDKLRQKVTTKITAFKKESDARIAEHKSEIDRIKALLPYAQMTMEDYAEAHPEDAFDTINRPTFWPHDDDIQPGYVDPNAKEEGGH